MNTIGSRGNWRSTLWTLLGLVGAGTLTLGASGCGEGEAADVSNYQIGNVTRSDLRITVNATGQIEPLQEIEVKSRASGAVLALHVESGQEVTKGQLLAEIDPRDVMNDYNQAKADLDVALARKSIAEKQFKRNERLRDAGGITTQQFETQQLEKANAEAALVRAQTALDLATLRKDDVQIKAPMNGTILTDSIQPGAVITSASGNISGGTTLMLMANLAEMKVKTFVDETDMGEIKEGMDATVTVEAYKDESFEGRVQKIEPQALNQQNVTMFAVIIHLDNSEGLLKPRMNAEVEILVASRPNTISAPATALVDVTSAVPAAIVLGLDESAVEIDQSVWTALMAQARAQAGEQDAPAAAEGGAVDMAAVWAKVQSGEITRDSARALMGAAGGGSGGGRPGGAASRGGGRPGGGFGGRGGGMMKNARFAFVLTADSTIEARPIIIGLSDWEKVEITAGLQEGETVAIISASLLKAEQQARIQRWTQRRGLF